MMDNSQKSVTITACAPSLIKDLDLAMRLEGKDVAHVVILVMKDGGHLNDKGVMTHYPLSGVHYAAELHTNSNDRPR